MESGHVLCLLHYTANLATLLLTLGFGVHIHQGNGEWVWPKFPLCNWLPSNLSGEGRIAASLGSVLPPAAGTAQHTLLVVSPG